MIERIHQIKTTIKTAGNKWFQIPIGCVHPQLKGENESPILKTLGWVNVISITGRDRSIITWNSVGWIGLSRFIKGHTVWPFLFQSPHFHPLFHFTTRGDSNSLTTNWIYGHFSTWIWNSRIIKHSCLPCPELTFLRTISVTVLD